MKINQFNLSSAKAGLENSREGVRMVSRRGKGGWKVRHDSEKKSEKNKNAVMGNLPWPLAEFILESWVGKMAQRLKICWEPEF